MQGFLNLYKPENFTSHDCVAVVRRTLGIKKIGHGGTLDPLATGVLPMAVGRATRLLQYLAPGKAYRAVVRFGITTTTDDLEGEILTRQPIPQLHQDQVRAQLCHFQGTIEQTPPSYSAIQVDGKRLYDLARKGKVVDVPRRRVSVHDISLVDWHAGDFPEAILDIRCGPGTYIRSIARDLGAQLSTGAVLAHLSRTHSSGFDLDGSITLAQLENATEAGTLELLPSEHGVQHLEAVYLDPERAKRWRQGQKLPVDDEPVALNIPQRVFDQSQERFLGIGQVERRDTQTVFVPKVVLEPCG